MTKVKTPQELLEVFFISCKKEGQLNKANHSSTKAHLHPLQQE